MFRQKQTGRIYHQLNTKTTTQGETSESDDSDYDNKTTLSTKLRGGNTNPYQTVKSYTPKDDKESADNKNDIKITIDNNDTEEKLDWSIICDILQQKQFFKKVINITIEKNNLNQVFQRYCNKHSNRGIPLNFTI